MRLKICCWSQPRTDRRDVSFCPSEMTSKAARSPRCMVVMSDCSVPPECSTGYSAKEKIVTLRTVKFTDHWEEEEEDGTKILHDRERFSHELTLVFANGKTQILTHEKKEAE